MFKVTVTAKFLKHAKIKIHGIVAYTILNVCEKNHQFLSRIKMMHTKENWFLISASPCTYNAGYKDKGHWLTTVSKMVVLFTFFIHINCHKYYNEGFDSKLTRKLPYCGSITKSKNWYFHIAAKRVNASSSFWNEDEVLNFVLSLFKNFPEFLNSARKHRFCYRVFIHLCSFSHVHLVLRAENNNTTTIVLRPLYRSTCVSQHLQLITGYLVGAKFYCPVSA